MIEFERILNRDLPKGRGLRGGKDRTGDHALDAGQGSVRHRYRFAN